MHILLVISLLVILVTGASGQFSDCAMLQKSELGDTTALSNTGLLADALAVQTGDGTVNYQLLEYNTVCLGQGTVRDTYRSISLVVRHLNSGGTEATQQLDLQCINGNWDIDNFEILASSIAAADGTLTTAVRRDCFACISPTLAGTQPFSTEEHCLSE